MINMLPIKYDDYRGSVVLIGIVAAIVYQTGKILYRLVWHPLAAIPGPKLAAATSLYGAFHDLLLDTSLVRKVAQLHNIYGPIVRISPNEVHVKDISSYYKIFKVGSDFEKEWSFYNSRAIEGSLLNILDTPTARQRREAYAKYFSREAIDKIEPLLMRHTNRFMLLLRRCYEMRKPVDLSRAFRCLTADVIIDYSFSQDFQGLKSVDFCHPVIEAGDVMLVYAQWGLYFRKLFVFLDTITDFIPDVILSLISPRTTSMKKFQQSCARNMELLKVNKNQKTMMAPTIFDTLLNPEENKGRPVPCDSHLTAESVLMLLAGTDTTSNALVVGVYHILQNKQIRQRLVAELCDSTIVLNKDASIVELRTLPYLNAVVKESLRLSFGAPGRIPRVIPASGAFVGSAYIPPGTIISHSAYVYHTDESVFPDSLAFIPERWLAADVKNLERYLLSFSRGSRMCLGIHLATSELLIVFARLFREMEFELFNTSIQDMKWSDYSVLIFKGHLKILVTRMLSRKV